MESSAGSPDSLHVLWEKSEPEGAGPLAMSALMSLLPQDFAPNQFNSLLCEMAPTIQVAQAHYAVCERELSTVAGKLQSSHGVWVSSLFMNSLMVLIC